MTCKILDLRDRSFAPIFICNDDDDDDDEEKEDPTLLVTGTGTAGANASTEGDDEPARKQAKAMELMSFIAGLLFGCSIDRSAVCVCVCVFVFVAAYSGS